MKLLPFVRSSALALTLAFAATSQAQNPLDDRSATRTSARDTTFLLNATQAALTDIELGRIAAERSAQSNIKTTGQALALNQMQTQAELQALAERRKVNVPTELPAESAVAVEDLESTTPGPGFDRRIVGQLVREQRKALGEFENAARNSRDPEIRSFAARKLPALQSQLERVEELNRSL